MNSLFKKFNFLEKLNIKTKFLCFFLFLYSLFNLTFQSFVLKFATSDFSEQLLWTQHLKFGYGIQPPFYSYLQIVFFKLFGLDFFALQSLHKILLISNFIFLFLSFRFFTKNNKSAFFLCTLAALSNIFVSNELIDIITRTHTTLVTAVASALLYSFCRIVKQQSLKNYALFGLVAAFGILSKYNFVLLLLLFFISCAFYKPYRPYLFNRKVLLSFLIIFVLLSPNVLWLYGHKDIILEQFHHKIHQTSESAVIVNVYVLALKRFVLEITSFFAPLSLLIGSLLFGSFCFKKSQIPLSEEENASVMDDEFLNYLWKFFFVSVIFIFILVLAFKITRIRGYWFQPIFTYVPGLIIFELLKRKFLNQFIRKSLLIIICISLFVTPFFKLIYVQNYRNNNFLSRRDIEENFVKPIKESAGENNHSKLLIVSTEKNIAGNMKLFFPFSRAILLGDPYNKELFDCKKFKKILFILPKEFDEKSILQTIYGFSPALPLKKTFEESKHIPKKRMENKDYKVSLWEFP